MKRRRERRGPESKLMRRLDRQGLERKPRHLRDRQGPEKKLRNRGGRLLASRALDLRPDFCWVLEEERALWPLYPNPIGQVVG